MNLALVVVKEAACDLEMLGLLVGDLFQALVAEMDDFCRRVGEKNRRVSGDNKLRAVFDEVIDGAQGAELTIR